VRRLLGNTPRTNGSNANEVEKICGAGASRAENAARQHRTRISGVDFAPGEWFRALCQVTIAWSTCASHRVGKRRSSSLFAGESFRRRNVVCESVHVYLFHYSNATVYVFSNRVNKSATSLGLPLANCRMLISMESN